MMTAPYIPDDLRVRLPGGTNVPDENATLARLTMHKLCPHFATQKGDGTNQFPGARTWDNATRAPPMLHSNERIVACASMHALS